MSHAKETILHAILIMCDITRDRGPGHMKPVPCAFMEGCMEREMENKEQRKV